MGTDIAKVLRLLIQLTIQPLDGYFEVLNLIKLLSRRSISPFEMAIERIGGFLPEDEAVDKSFVPAMSPNDLPPIIVPPLE